MDFTWLKTLELILWLALASLGFALLFNVPRRCLPFVVILASLGGLAKLVLLHFGFSLVGASFCGATLIGMISIPFAHFRHAPHVVFSIPAIIPMIPGVFAYRMALGVIKLATLAPDSVPSNLLVEVVQNGLTVAMVSMAIAIGVAMPFLLTRQKSGKFLMLLHRP